MAYDKCYHQACDTINNLNSKALFELGDAAAHATLTLALSKTGLFPGRQPAGSSQGDRQGSGRSSISSSSQAGQSCNADGPALRCRAVCRR